MPDLRLRSVVVVCRRSDIWFGRPGDWHRLDSARPGQCNLAGRSTQGPPRRAIAWHSFPTERRASRDIKGILAESRNTRADRAGSRLRDMCGGRRVE